MAPALLHVTREQVLAFRRRSSALDARLPPGAASVRRAAWAGLTDSMPRAALLQLHARVACTAPDALDDPALVQVWGPRFSTYVVPAADHAVFTVSRTPLDADRRASADGLAERLVTWLDGREVDARVAGRALGVHPQQFRWASTTGRVLIRWPGAGQPTVRAADVPEVDPADARLELLRRYLHVLGPGTPTGFGDWAGLRAGNVAPTFAALAPELVPVGTDLGEAWALAADEADLRRPAPPDDAAPHHAPPRLLPSGDTYYLLQGQERERLVPDPARRAELWTTRVWPGAVVVGGEVVGTWRRADEKVGVSLWEPLDDATREALEAEATSMPLPGLRGPVVVRWDG